MDHATDHITDQAMDQSNEYTVSQLKNFVRTKRSRRVANMFDRIQKMIEEEKDTVDLTDKYILDRMRARNVYGDLDEVTKMRIIVRKMLMDEGLTCPSDLATPHMFKLNTESGSYTFEAVYTPINEDVMEVKLIRHGKDADGDIPARKFKGAVEYINIGEEIITLDPEDEAEDMDSIHNICTNLYLKFRDLWRYLNYYESPSDSDNTEDEEEDLDQFLADSGLKPKKPKN